MSPRARPRFRNEDGSSLIIMLALLSFLGVMLASVLTVAFASFKTSEVTRGSNTRLYSADAGADYGIELLRDNTSYCPEISASPQSLPSQSLNGRTVDVTCQTLSGGSSGAPSGPTSYSLILTAYTPPGGSAPDKWNLFRMEDSAGAATTIHLGHKVFNAGAFQLTSSAPKALIQGDLDQYDSPSTYCTTDKSQATSISSPQATGAWTCRTPSSFPIPDPNPTVKVPTSTAPAKTVVSGCTIYYPGKYTSSNKPTFSASGKTYFASGVYYFEGAGEIQMEGQVFGGQPGAGGSQQIAGGVSPCATDAVANSYRPGSATGSGVEFVLGGTSRLKVASAPGNKIELFARQPAVPANEGTPGISLFAPKTAGTGYQAWNDAQAFILDSTEATVIFHGLVYVPNSPIVAWAVPNTGASGAAQFAGGLVASSLEVKASSSSIGTKFAGVPTAAPTPRTVVVTATAPGTVPGEVPTVIKAVVQLGTSSSTPPTVLSWRKV